MENPGLVMLTSNYIFLEKVSKNRITSFAMTALHELSHMWFGDLVTMEWWDDIWLNESFATYIAHFIATKFPAEMKEKYENTPVRLQIYK